MRLTAHFTLEEFVISQYAVRFNVDNTPSDEVVDNLRALASYLEDLRALIGQAIVISSGYRCAVLNSATGGARGSAHLTGYAVDILSPAFGTPLSLCRAVVSLDQPFDQVIHEYGRWTHVSIDPKMRRQQLTICSGTGYRSGLLECRTQ